MDHLGNNSKIYVIQHLPNKLEHSTLRQYFRYRHWTYSQLKSVCVWVCVCVCVCVCGGGGLKYKSSSEICQRWVIAYWWKLWVPWLMCVYWSQLIFACKECREPSANAPATNKDGLRPPFNLGHGYAITSHKTGDSLIHSFTLMIV